MCAKNNPLPIKHWVVVVQDAWSMGFSYEDYLNLANRYNPLLHKVCHDTYYQFKDVFDNDMEQHIGVNRAVLLDKFGG